LITSVDFQKLQLPEERYTEYKLDLVKRLQAMPGVESAAEAMLVPFGGSTWNDDVINEGSDGDAGVAWLNYLGQGYFQTIGTPLLAGRDFNDRDTATWRYYQIRLCPQDSQRRRSATARGFTHEPPGKPGLFTKLWESQPIINSRIARGIFALHVFPGHSAGKTRPRQSHPDSLVAALNQPHCLDEANHRRYESQHRP
jgi:hypothetical protein